jgi:hypothetical protein
MMHARLLAMAGAAVLLGALLSPAPAAAEPMTVGIVLDTSGSVGREFDRTRELCVSLLKKLPPGSEVALFTFDDQDRLLLPWTTAAGDLERALSIVRPTGRFTLLYDALFAASRQLRDARAGRKAIVLLTDGKDEGSTLTLEDGLRVAQDSRVPIVTVGVGRAEEKILRRIAKLTDGEYVPLASANADDIVSFLQTTPSAGAPPASAPAARGSSAASGAAPLAPASAAAPSSSAAPARGWRGLALVLGVAVPVLLVAAVAGVALLRRRRSRATCPVCSFELPSELARCTNCSATANSRIAESVTRVSGPVRLSAVKSPEARREQPREAKREREAWPKVVGGDSSVLSETVLARLNNTEEFLEKTVTLREQPVLAVTRGPAAGQVFTLSQQTSTSLGRAKMNDVVLDDLSVSSEHCRIRPENDGFAIHDLKSTNGTYVNEKKITHHPLTAGDVIKIGETSLVFRLDHQRTS